MNRGDIVIVKCCLRHRGYTLLELLLAMAIFISLSAGLSYAIIRGVQAHNFETSYREATLQTRNALTQMVEELRTATVPEDLQSLAKNEFAIPSAVWFPDSYGTTSSANSLAGYQLGAYFREVNGKKIEVYRGYNRLIFTRKNPSYTNSSSINDKYVFVDWFVSKTHPNRLYRIVRKIRPDAMPYHVVGGQYKFTSPESYLGNGGDQFGSMACQSGKHADYIVVQLPGPQDVISFAVEHNINEDIFAKGSLGSLDKNNAKYDPNLFNIIVKATVYERSFEDKRDINVINNPTSNPDSNAYVDPADPNFINDYSSPAKRMIVYKEQAYISH